MPKPYNRDLLVLIMSLACFGCSGKDNVLPVSSTFSISGTFTAAGPGTEVAGISVNADDGAHMTSSNIEGKYTIFGLSPGYYTITPHKSGFVFAPQSHQITITGQDVPNVDFDIYWEALIDTVHIPGGTFIMGYASDQGSRPLHEVTVRSFAMSKYEATQDVWKKVIGQDPSDFIGSDRPVNRVTWYGAVEFCNALSLREGLPPAYTIQYSPDTSISCDFKSTGYRLPTEAEWEYACRGGTTADRYSSEINQISWHRDNSGGAAQPVGQKFPNAFGLYDMLGNVFEWCWDWRALYTSDPQDNPTGKATGNQKMLRGGSWYFDASSHLAGFRLAYPPDVQYNGIGFRVVRSIE